MNSIRDEVTRPYMSSVDGKAMLSALKMDMDSGITVPDKHSIFRCFDIEAKDVRLVIVGNNPYKDGDGLAFSSFKDWDSMHPFTAAMLNAIRRQLYDYMGEATFKGAFPTGNLLNWKERGALLMNAVLTCTSNDVKAHYDIGWEKLTLKVLEHVNGQQHAIAFLFIGKKAEELGRQLKEKEQHLYRYLPYKPEEMEKDKNTFSTIHSFIRSSYAADPFWKHDRKDYTNFAVVDVKGMIASVKRDILEAQVPIPGSKEAISDLSKEAIMFMADLDMNLRANLEYVFDFRTKL